MSKLKWERPSGFFTSDVLAQTIPPRHLEEDDPLGPSCHIVLGIKVALSGMCCQKDISVCISESCML